MNIWTQTTQFSLTRMLEKEQEMYALSTPQEREDPAFLDKWNKYCASLGTYYTGTEIIVHNNVERSVPNELHTQLFFAGKQLGTAIRAKNREDERVDKILHWLTCS